MKKQYVPNVLFHAVTEVCMKFLFSRNMNKFHVKLWSETKCSTWSSTTK